MVYVDQVLIGNLIMNYVILWAAGRLGQVRQRFPRLLLAAGVGSIYSLLSFFPSAGWLYNLPAKALMSLVMVLVAFAPLSWRVLAGCFCFFYLASFSLGGMVFGFTYLLHSSPVIAGEAEWITSVTGRYFWAVVLLALCFFWAVYYTGGWFFRKKGGLNRFQVPLGISIYGRNVKVNALVDTGNSLMDPLTGEPVIVVEYSAIKVILPSVVKVFFEKKELDYTSLLAALEGTPWAARFRVIPFHSLGMEHGLLVGIRPDEVEIDQNGGKALVDRVVIGISRSRLNSGSAYHALLHPGLLETA